MRRIFIALLLTLAGAGVSQAQVFPIRGWCEAGAQPVVLAGLNSTTQVQASYPQCTVNVFIHGDGAATIFADANSTPLGNPFTAQTNGQWLFYAAPGRYDVQLSGGGLPTTITYSDINTVGAGGGGVPGGSPIQTQVNNSGVFGGTSCESFGNITTGPESLDCDSHFKGPNPYIDITRFGARSCNQSTAPCAAGVTASININSTTATLSSASTFINGDGVVIFGAGAPNSVTTPTGLAITNVLAQAGTGTGQVVTGAAGGTTRCYKIIARDTGGGYTAASAEVCNATGQTNLGAITVNISSCTRAQTLVTCTTSSATPLNINNVNSNVGGEVYIGGSPSDSSFRGWREVAAVSDSTHFTFIDTTVSTSNGGSTSETGGTATFFAANHLTWTAVTNAWLYYIYEGSSGAETLVGVSRPQGISAGVVDATFDDFGPTLMANYVFPSWIPTTPPTLAANDNLSTTIVSGAGTTTLTLATTAGATVSGAGIRLDAGPAFIAAAAVANQSGPLFIPVSANPFVINNYCDLSPYQLSVIQSGQLYLHETISLHGLGLRWVGDRITGIGPQSGAGGGGWGAYPQIVVAEAVPGMYINAGGFAVDGISFQPGVTNGVLQMVADWSGSFNAALIDTGFAPGTTTANLMGFGIIFRGANGLVWDRGGWGTGNSADTSSHNAGFYCSGCGDVTLRKMFTTGRGMIFKGSPAGTGALRIEEVHYNGGGTPLVSTLGTVQAALGQPGAQIQMDTVGHPCLSAFGGQATVYDNNCAPSGFTFISPSVTGVVQFAAGGISVPAVPGSGLSVSPGISLTTQLLPTVSSFDAIQSMIYNVAGPGGISVGPDDSIFANGLIPTPPTCSVSAGGSLALGTYVFGVQPVYWNGLEGTPSAASAGCTTTPGNQTITVNWTTLPAGGPVGYNIYTGGPAGGGTCAACINPFPPSVTQLVWSSGLAGAPAQNLVPLGGPSMLLPNARGVVAPEVSLANVTGIATGVTSENSAYDNFNRANGAIGSNWTVKVGGVNVSSNVAVGTTSANAVAWNQANFSSFAQFSKITLVTLNGTTDLNGPLVFSQLGANSDYECVENTTTISIQQVLNGSSSVLATTPSGGSPGDVLLLVATVNPSGTQPTTTLTCSRNGSVVLTTTSTTFTSGSAGFRLNGSVATVDNWSGGNLHPVSQLDTEQEWTQPQHFLGTAVTIGPTSYPVNAALAANTLYVPNIINGTGSSLAVPTVGANLVSDTATQTVSNKTLNSPVFAGTSTGPGSSQVAYLTSTYTNATTTFSNVTGLSFSVAANANYKIRCDLAHSTSATTTGFKFQWTGPAAPTAVSYEGVEYISTSTFSTAGATAFSTSTGLGSGTVITDLPVSLTLTVLNGANAGTVQLQAAATGAGTLTILPGSCSLLQ